MGVAGLAATLLVSNLTVNRVVKRKLKLSAYLFLAYIAVNVIAALRPDLAGAGRVELDAQLRAFERIGLVAALINLVVVSLLNPLRSDRVADRFPTILQDAIVIGLLLIVSTFVFEEKLLTTSAISAVVIGFALQDTLGNAFAGLAIQSERPFNVGHWIQVGQFEGRVTEVTWRATKLRTKAGNFVVLPNNLVGKEAITNFSEPTAPTMLEVEVGVAYDAVPNHVKRVIREAMTQCSCVLASPAPDALLRAFDASAITYRARFWVLDYERDEESRDQVRTAIYYAFSRQGIEIPYPIQIEYSREWPDRDDVGRQREREALIAGVDIFQSLERGAQALDCCCRPRPACLATAKSSFARRSRVRRCMSSRPVRSRWCWSLNDRSWQRSRRAATSERCRFSRVSRAQRRCSRRATLFCSRSMPSCSESWESTARRRSNASALRQ